MKYVIIAAGKGTRWNNYLGVPKHLIKINGETLLERTTRLLKENGIKDYIITSKDPRYAKYGKIIPQSKYDCEIDRFEEVSSKDGICYLYGDVYFTEQAIQTIIHIPADDILFFGHEWEIFAIKIINTELFFKHKQKVKQLFLSKQIDRSIGWEIYRSLHKIPFNEHKITDRYIKILDGTDDIDYPCDYEDFKKRLEGNNNGNY